LKRRNDMSGKTRRNGFMFVAAMCLGLVGMPAPNTASAGHGTNMAAASKCDPGSNWSFALMTDTHSNTPVIKAMVESIVKDCPSFVIVLGDLQTGTHGHSLVPIDEQLSIWTNDVSALGRAGIPYYAVRGNHETYDDVDPNPAHVDWTTHVGRYMPTNGPAGEIGMTYSFPYGNALFIGLDNFNGTNDESYYCKISKSGQDWLDAQLAANTRPHLFVFGHEPAFRSWNWCLTGYGTNYPCNITERNQFWDSIGNANARIYFCGHSHVYGRCQASITNEPTVGPTARQIIIGCGGGKLRSWQGAYSNDGNCALIVPEQQHTNTYDYMLVRVNGNQVAMAYKISTNLATWTTNNISEHIWFTNDVFQYTVADAPTNVSASDGTIGGVDVSWDAVAGASAYDVWRGTNASAAGRARIGGATNTLLFRDNGALSGVIYYYWVRAINADGAGQFSVSASGRIGAETDFDGDAVSDLWRFVGENWYIWMSGTAYQRSGPLGHSVSDGAPVVGDLDGDGRADLALAVGSSWYLWLSGGSYQRSGPYDLGVAGSPVMADFDGDGRADPAMLSGTAWYLWFSGGNYQRSGPVDLGIVGQPIGGDYDGDHKSDPVILVGSAWYFWFSGNSYQCSGPYNLGVAGTPLAGDYDHDGKADPAIIDASGNCYYWQSSRQYQYSGPYPLSAP